MRRLVILVAFVAVLAGLWIISQVDWDSYGPATPPLAVDVVDESAITIKQFHFGGSQLLISPPTFDWSQYVDVSIEATSPPGTFRFRVPSHTIKQKQELSRKQAGVPSAAFRIDIVRNSSLKPGFVVASATGSGVKCDRAGKMTWSSQIWIPQVPGKYRVRLILISEIRHETGDGTSKETIISSFPLSVIPEKK